MCGRVHRICSKASTTCNAVPRQRRGTWLLQRCAPWLGSLKPSRTLVPAGMLPRFATPLLAGPTPLLTVDHCAGQAAGVAELPAKLNDLMQGLRWCCVQSWRLLGQAQTAVNAHVLVALHQKSFKQPTHNTGM